MILDKCSYIRRMEEILNDNSKFSKLDIPAAGKEIKHIINLEKRIQELKLLRTKKLLTNLLTEV